MTPPPGSDDINLNTMPQAFTTLLSAVSNPDPLDYSFDDMNTMPFTTLLSAQIAEW